MYKMIAIDLDGTLLNDEKKVPKENIEILNRLYIEKGILPVITTGRPYVSAKHIAGTVGDSLKQYIISANGSYIRDNKSDADVNNDSIAVEDSIRILDICNKYGFKHSADIGEVLLKSPSKIDEETYKNLGQPYKIVENVKEYIKENETRAFVITFMGDRARLESAIVELKQIDGIEPSEMCEFVAGSGTELRKGTYIDIMKKGCNKANGVKILASHLGINREEIMAIGDGGNDLPMFEVAGFKVAMGNGLDIVKEIADYITDTNNDSGVATAIEELILSK